MPTAPQVSVRTRRAFSFRAARTRGVAGAALGPGAGAAATRPTGLTPAVVGAGRKFAAAPRHARPKVNTAVAASVDLRVSRARKNPMTPVSPAGTSAWAAP